MKLKLFFILTFLGTLVLSAQIDSENKSLAIPAEIVEDPKADNELIVQPEEQMNATPDETSKNEVTLPKTEELPVAERKAFSITEDNEFRNPSELYQKQLKNALKLKTERERKNNGSSTTQYLGEYLTKAKRINVMYRDHSAADGDLVRVYVNDDVIVSRELLESHTKGFFLTLVEGDNVIDIEALNEGASGPNTAEIIVLDDKGDVLLRSQWNLNTGVKATFTVRLIKDE